MCGIAGFVSHSAPGKAREAAVGRMCHAMEHRGPDDEGFVSSGAATLGNRRLAIFDPANGRQPMVSPDGRWSLVFNGAIYNFKELRAELTGRHGWRFRTDCDTEVLLAAVAVWGAGAQARLRGMYAFAAWDRDEASLLLARDAFGIKPLYLYQHGGDLLFASELNALLASGAVPRVIDPAAVADYLAWFAVPAPRTIYRDVISLRPGEQAVFKAGALTVTRAWAFTGIPDAPPATSAADFSRQLRARLEDTIRAHLVADVPVGAFLSGGLDSSAVVGLMTRATGRPLRTFCISFEEPGYSEGEVALEAARHFGAIHHNEILTGGRVAADLDRLLGSFDQPSGDGINTYYASQTARAGGVTVALSGLGGDELFGGYPSFRDTPRLARLLPAWRLLPEGVRARVLDRLEVGDTRRRKLADMLQHAASMDEVGAMQRRVFSLGRQRQLLHPDALTAAGGIDPFHPELAWLVRQLGAASAFDRVSAWELRTYMADVLLRDSDVMSMRHSLELRVPFVDRPLIEWLWRQPRRTREHKAALYDAVADLLPPGLAHRRKRGFTLPFARWMKQELRPFLEDTFAPGNLERSGLFAPMEVSSLWRGFLEHNDTREWSRLWSLAVLVNFANRQPSLSTARPAPPAVTVTPSRPFRRALLMAPEIYASEGGIPRILQSYLKALALQPGLEGLRLLALNDPPADVQTGLKRDGLAAELSHGCSRGKVTFVRRALEYARDCDVVVCGHIAQLPVAWLARQLNPRLRYYLIAHGIEVWRPFSAPEKTALRGAERVLCVSDYTRRVLLGHCPLREGQAVVLHNALDPVFPIGPGRPLAECPPVILVVTRITWADRYKGVEHMIQAMPAILAEIPDARLRLVGRGDDVPRLQAMVQELGIQAAVDFMGYVDDDQLKEEMRSCRLFALPSRKEGFGLVFLEAMAHGRPCLGANAGGVPEVITPESGMLVEYGDVDAIAKASVSALGRDWNQTEILDRARTFSFEAFCARLSNHLTR